MNCDQCTLDGRTCQNYIPRQSQWPVLFIGQAPGKTEIITGMPFTGSAGKMLYSLCQSAGLYKRDIPQANLVLCKPPDDGKGNDRAPTSLEMQCCEESLKETIGQVRPELIVAFGTVAAKELTGLGPVSSLHGGFYPLLPRWEWECQVLCCYHPSFVMRQRQQIPVAIKDLALVNTFFTQGIKKRGEINYILDPSVEELREYLERGRGKVTAFDTETTGLNKRKDRVIGCSFCNSVEDACAIYFVENDSRLGAIREFLEDEQFKKCTQNGSYDMEIVFNSLGIEVRGWVFDTKIAEQLLNSDLPKDLDHLRAMYTDMEPYKPSKKEVAQMQYWGKEKMLLYAAKDALCTELVRRAQEPLLGEQQKDLMKELLIPASLALNKMERRGMDVDVNTLAVMYANVIPEIEQLEQEIREELGISISSPKQITSYFNIDSSDREALEALVTRGHEKSEAIQKILRHRDLSKGASTFLRGVYERLEDGKIHTEYNISGTGTGRLSSKNPNLQNVQKKYRAIYVPPSGHVTLSGDYKQLELRVASILAPCEMLAQALRDGVDVHNQVLEQIREYIPERLLWNARNVAKQVVFGTLYGRSARSIAIQFGVTIASAESWQDMCFNRFPGLRKYCQDRMTDYRQRGFVTTPFGRKRYIQTYMQAVNAPIQSSANDIKLGALIKLDEEGFDLRLDVHDAIVCVVPKRALRGKARRMKELLEYEVPEMGGASFKAEMEWGENWYEMKGVEI